MRAGVVVFARMSSSRLPGKALRDLAGRPLLGRVLDRLRIGAPGWPLVVATSDRADDDAIADFAEKETTPVFRGSLDDVASRAVACADREGYSCFARVSGDSPFVDGNLVDRMIRRHLDHRPDLTTNVFPRSFPPGASVEVIDVDVLRSTISAMSADEREHVTAHFYANPRRFRIENMPAPDGRYGGVALTVDSPEDMARARRIAQRLGQNYDSASLDKIVEIARAVDREQAAAHE